MLLLSGIQDLVLTSGAESKCWRGVTGNRGAGYQRMRYQYSRLVDGIISNTVGAMFEVSLTDAVAALGTLGHNVE